MRFREHRGQFGDSIETLVELHTREQLVLHIEKLHEQYMHGFDFSKLTVKPYFMQPDERCGWEKTYIVSLDGYGVLGFTDTPVEAGTGIEPVRSGI